MKKILYLYILFFCPGMLIAFSLNEYCKLSKKNIQAIHCDARLGPLLAKINAACKFQGKVKICQILITRKNEHLSAKEAIKEIHEDIETKKMKYLKYLLPNKAVETSSLVIVTTKDGNSTFFPYYFNSIAYFSSNPLIKTENFCQTSFFSLSDDKIQNTLGAENLGGSGWIRKHDFIKNWKKKWMDGNLLFLVDYNDNLFMILPLKDTNIVNNQTNSDAWHSLFTKKGNLVPAAFIILLSHFLYQSMAMNKQLKIKINSLTQAVENKRNDHQ